ncbi:uncharacterized protein N7477_001129 [Penicillium maclennaniae]|uniref:uncharacterized protein n=1 Tax=Penicillium maclennaniae TaxID=1343394 RepID=UPI0025400DD9|nr:uncharacterized protein N7477_001129 [Penicillium maclennaniae]KAJ5684784.1 hypothetical protein N7477_001129 [Penicillium maclennaniae]
MAQIPHWQLPNLSDDAYSQPSWMVAFLLPMEDDERDLIMQKLISTDKAWLDPPCYGAAPSPGSPLAARSDPAVVDEQSRVDDTVILLHNRGREIQAVRVPINRANVLLSAAEEGNVNLDGVPVLPNGLEKQNTKKRPVSNSDCVLILESMTKEELQTIQEELFSEVDTDLEWIDLSQKLGSSDMEGLMDFFESKDYELDSPPDHFIAVDRKTLRVANKPVDQRDESKSVILASIEGGLLWFKDDMEDIHGSIYTGYGFQRSNVEDSMTAVTNLSVGNMDFAELFDQSEFIYWSGYHSWAASNLENYQDGDKQFASAWYPGRGRVDCAVDEF